MEQLNGWLGLRSGEAGLPWNLEEVIGWAVINDEFLEWVCAGDPRAYTFFPELTPQELRALKQAVGSLDIKRFAGALQDAWDALNQPHRSPRRAPRRSA